MAGKTYNISISTGNTPLVKNVALLAAGAVAASVFAALRRRLAPHGGVAGAAKAGAADANRSTTSSAGGGAGAYETRKAVDEYLQFHYGRAEELLPYSNGPKVGSRGGGRGGTGAGRLAQQRHGRAQGGTAAVPRHGAMRQLCLAARGSSQGAQLAAPWAATPAPGTSLSSSVPMPAPGCEWLRTSFRLWSSIQRRRTPFCRPAGGAGLCCAAGGPLRAALHSAAGLYGGAA